jgi:hypothetical protein
MEQVLSSICELQSENMWTFGIVSGLSTLGTSQVYGFFMVNQSSRILQRTKDSLPITVTWVDLELVMQFLEIVSI